MENKQWFYGIGRWWCVTHRLVTSLIFMYIQQVQSDIVCDSSPLSLSCGENDVIMVSLASYGRMEKTKCLHHNEMIGCSNDVTFLLDQWCSGQSNCEKDLPNPDLNEANNNCPKVSRLYLDVSYTCLKVTMPVLGSCTNTLPVVIKEAQGFLSSHVMSTTGCGSTRSPWRLQAMEGQTFQLTLYDFGAEAYARTTNVTGSPPPVARYGYIRDGLGADKVVIQGGQEKERTMLTSSSNTVDIEFMSSSYANILVQFKVLGCPELKPPTHAWYKRDGSQAVIGCEWSQTTWHLSCDGHRWSGVVGNCSGPVTHASISQVETPASEYPLALLLTCVVSVAVVLVVILVVICVVCLKKQRIKQHVAKKMVASPGHYDLDPSIEMGSILFFPNKPCDCPEPQPLVPLVDLGEQDPEQGQGQECNPLHIWEQPLPELPPKTKRKSTTDSTMGTRTGRTPGDGDEHVSDVMEGDVRSLNSEPFSTQSSHKYSPLERN